MCAGIYSFHRLGAVMNSCLVVQNCKFKNWQLLTFDFEIKPEDTCENSGLRQIAKLCLNSLWGKFGQRTNLGKSEIVKTKEELYKIIFNDKYENIELLNPNLSES